MRKLIPVLAVLALTGCAQIQDSLKGKFGIGAEFMGAKIDLSYDSRPLVSVVAAPIRAGTDAVGITTAEAPKAAPASEAAPAAPKGP